MSTAEERALKYAEQVLGVHDVYTGSQVAQGDLKDAQKAQVEAATRKRVLTEAISERTSVLTSDLRGKYAELSATAFEQILKSAIPQDADLKRLRESMIEVHTSSDWADAQVREAEFRLRIGAARMTELGGLLTFYAAVKHTKP